MGGLASTVAMSKSGLFAHFGSKEELQLATVACAWQIFEAEVLPGPRDEDDLEKLLERWLSFLERRVFPGGCFFVVSAVEFAALGGPVRDALAATIDRQVAALEAALSAAREPSRGRDDQKATAFALHSMLTHAHSLFTVHGDPLVFDHARNTMGDLLGERWHPQRRALVRPV